MKFRIIELGEAGPFQAVSLDERPYTHFVDPVVTPATLQKICDLTGGIEIRGNEVYELFPDIEGWVHSGTAGADGNFSLRLLSLTCQKA